MKRSIFPLSFVKDKERKMPIGIDNNGVKKAIPGSPKFLLTFTIKRFQEVNTRLVLFGNNLLYHIEIISPKKVKTKTPMIPPPTVLT